MESFAVWYYLLVVLPLALEALAGPVLLKQQGLKAVVPALAVLWVAPVALMHYVVGVPEISPVEELRERPPGRAPFVTAKEMGPKLVFRSVGRAEIGRAHV